MSLKRNFCPVPFDQQPLNEYNAIKQSTLFSCSAASINIFVRSLVIIFIISNLIGLLFILFMLHGNKISLITFFYNLLFSFIVIEILLIRLYLGWSYIFKRLSSASIFYEESGWYDGQLWVKSADVLTQDRLVSLYQVEPLIKRIKNILSIISCFLAILCFILYIF
uniref:Ycf36 n=1 Tax=Dichotomaria marginata TaxID=268567 RepID=A0A1G4NSB6_9FLOR|nr:Hypothetical protein ycf36 [Dichotomaria marginata]SCW21572.1 Hypothetical protein ycf36 [Dichotomaria marginata]